MTVYFPDARLYSLHDSDPKIRETEGAQPVSRSVACAKNREGYGIFQVVNAFRGARRLVNLTRINWWFADLDEGSKSEQLLRIRQAPVLPSVVVESRNGYHCYWRVRGRAGDHWRRIVRWGIVPVVRGDPRATDCLRLLRAPGFDHCKGVPFAVRVVWAVEAAYTECQMLRAFPSRGPQPPVPRPAPAPGEGTFWQRVAALDGREAIRATSGTWLVDYEQFTLAEQANGNANIIRGDGVSTGCWVWATGRLGGVDGGGSIAAWCRWYGHSWKEIADGLRELFPELENDSD